VRALRLAALALVVALLAGCGGHKHQTARMPAPPPTIYTTPAPPPRTVPAAPSSHEKVIYTETGYASWYGPPYHNRKAANGQIYDQDALTAAHLTLPFGSRVRVTNLKSGESVIVTINDRGPFVENRIIDLSRAAAKAVNVWRPGTAKVRLDVLEAPADIAHGGRWCVQIGAFKDYDQAADLKQELKNRYSAAKVIQFTGPTGEWVRVRVPQDDKRQAQQVAASTHTSAPVWLVRMD
jgi:rare lipoprotein A